MHGGPKAVMPLHALALALAQALAQVWLAR